MLSIWNEWFFKKQIRDNNSRLLLRFTCFLCWAFDEHLKKASIFKGQMNDFPDATFERNCMQKACHEQLLHVHCFCLSGSFETGPRTLVVLLALCHSHRLGNFSMDVRIHESLATQQFLANHKKQCHACHVNCFCWMTRKTYLPALRPWTAVLLAYKIESFSMHMRIHPRVSRRVESRHSRTTHNKKQIHRTVPTQLKISTCIWQSTRSRVESHSQLTTRSKP